MRLTMTAESHGVTDGDKAPSTARIKSFRVWGLPREQQALIYNLGDPLRDDWEVQRTENLNSEILSTGHPTAEAALKALQAKVDIEHVPTITHKWERISDISPPAISIRDRELEALSQVWFEQKKMVADSERIMEFNAQLGREWAIETGIIEGVYKLERGTTKTLIARGIDSAFISHDATDRDPELVARTIRAHEEVLEGLFVFVKGERTLSTSYIKELHSALLRYQETVVVFDQFGKAFETTLERGAYKTLPNNPSRSDGTTHEYCPPEHVASEMDRLIELHHQHARQEVRPHVQAAWLHHAFTQIHPFQDGNGRVARALASLVLIKAGLLPLLIDRDSKEKYIEVLEAADHGKTNSLFEFFAQVEKRTLTKAIGSAADVKPVSSVAEAVKVTCELLVNLGKIIPAQYLQARTTAQVLVNQALSVLNQVSKEFESQVTKAEPSYQFKVELLQSPPVKELGSIAATLHYDMNLREDHQSVALVFSAGGASSRIVVSVHGVGATFRGLLVSSAYFDAGEGRLVPISDDIFRISYEEPLNEAVRRYISWLDACLIKGLAEWRRTLV